MILQLDRTKALLSSNDFHDNNGLPYCREVDFTAIRESLIVAKFGDESVNPGGNWVRCLG